MQAQQANHALVEPFLRFWISSVVVVDGLSLVCIAFMPCVVGGGLMVA